MKRSKKKEKDHVQMKDIGQSYLLTDLRKSALTSSELREKLRPEIVARHETRDNLRQYDKHGTVSQYVETGSQ